jgi:hypothetical protein
VNPRLVFWYPFYQLRIVRYHVGFYLRAVRKNQKYSKEEMYLAIELWQESGLSQVKFCSREKLSVKTFSYWYRKYKKGKGFSDDFFLVKNLLSVTKLNVKRFQIVKKRLQDIYCFVCKIKIHDFCFEYKTGD